jgi:hypothetical protein
MSTINELIKERGRLENLMFSCWKANRTCLVPGCSNPAANSHHLQLRGALKFITEGHSIVQFTPSTYREKARLEWKSARKSTMVTFRGFCKECDKKVFSPIEDKPVDYLSYEHQRLFAYRSLLNEFRKVEWLLEFHTTIADESEGFNERSRNFHSKAQVTFSARLGALKLCKEKFELELSDNNPRFKSFHISLPKHELAASGCIAVMRQYTDEFLSNVSDFTSAKYIIVNALPTATSLELILFWDLDLVSTDFIPVDKFQEMTKSEIINMVSNFLIYGIENWAISGNAYKRILAGNMEERIINAKNNNSTLGNETVKFGGRLVDKESLQDLSGINIFSIIGPAS